MDNSVLVASEELLKRLDRVEKFESKYGVFPHVEAGKIRDEMRTLAGSLPDIQTPEDREQLLQAELRRRLNGEAFTIEQRVTPSHYDFDTIVSIFGIPKEDIEGLKGWLTANRAGTLEAIERLYRIRNVQSYELGVPLDITPVSRQATEFAAVHVKKYHKRLGKLLQDLTKVGEFLRDIDAVPTRDKRSYFNALTKTLAISIPAVCLMTEDGNLQINEREMIRLYRHEGMGHALNDVVTRSNGLPYFLKQSAALTRATGESVAQFYEKVIFEDLLRHPEVQKDLGIKHNFDEIYQEEKDTRQIKEYQAKFCQYAIKVLADKSLGNPEDQATSKKKMGLLEEVTLDPSLPRHFVEGHKNDFDSEGNLKPSIVRELMYCTQSAQRARDEFEKQGIKYDSEGRSMIDSVLLKGFWTPMGFVDNARLAAQKK